MNTLLHVILLGIGTTLFMDIWGLVQKRLFGTPLPNYAMVGRWVGHMPSGQITHSTIAQAPAVTNENAIGWTTHYVIGIVFCMIFIGVVGSGWLVHPTLLPALIMGIVSMVAPQFVMMPAFGFGMLSSKTPNPGKALRGNFIGHLSFGIGAFVAGSLLALMA